MTYEGAYPHINCIGPGNMTREQLIDVLVDQNATCRCGAPFDDGDVCRWPGGKARIEHVDCQRPWDPTEEQRVAAAEAIKAGVK